MSDLIKVGDMELSLADLAGLDMSTVAEYRVSAFPQGTFAWRGILAEIRPIDTQDGKKAAIVFEAECTQVYAVADESVDADSLIGRKHQESFFLNDLQKGLGAAKAFMVDCGMSGSGALTELLTQFTGHEFGAQVKHRKDKNDPDKIYAGFRKAMPLAEFAAAVGG